ncbi:aspartate/glutamate racemase family protein [Ectobacillus ponti]|uniref:Amino acid racemase n=1 Tax=Ectobacillus ponti TaxID=2961894 RepID=A0AA41XAU6_9BACI|nr:amino acid racemase [Ectobacillus ponti]MCP8969540.1 amino acid racemase [Ectobacillus ponti]
MKKIGLIGGLSWESTVLYYEHINTLARKASAHCAKIILHGMDFAEVTQLTQQGSYDVLQEKLIATAQKIEASGADCILMCSNAVHQFAGAVQSSLSIPLLHIADAAADSMNAHRIRKAGVLGTKQTMEQDFYHERLAAHGITSLIPSAADRDVLQQIIFQELTKGILSSSSKQHLQDIAGRLKADGAEGIVLGCTELPLLLAQDDVDIPLFNTTYLHAEQAVQFALAPVPI